MLYLRFEVIRPDASAVSREVGTTVHLMFRSEDVRICTAEAVALLRQHRCRGMQLKEARVGDAQEEFVDDERLLSLAEQASTGGMAHEFVDRRLEAALAEAAVGA